MRAKEFILNEAFGHGEQLDKTTNANCLIPCPLVANSQGSSATKLESNSEKMDGGDFDKAK